MNADDLFAAIKERRIILFRGHVFFNTRDYDEVLSWERLGAKIIPWYTSEQMESLRFRREKGQIPVPGPGWEIHVLPMLDPDWLEAGGEETNVAPEKLRELCRQSI